MNCKVKLARGDKVLFVGQEVVDETGETLGQTIEQGTVLRPVSATASMVALLDAWGLIRVIAKDRVTGLLSNK